jgi:hypothetical protein
MSSNEIELNNSQNFINTSLESPITEVALALAVCKDDTYYPSGTAVVIGQQLAITARHVITDFLHKFGNVPKNSTPDENFNADFNIVAFQVVNKATTGNLWNIKRIWSSGFTDIVLLQLMPDYQSGKEYKWKSLKMDLLPPPLGDKIAAFGYRSPEITLNPKQVIWGR